MLQKHIELNDKYIESIYNIHNIIYRKHIGLVILHTNALVLSMPNLLDSHTLGADWPPISM